MEEENELRKGNLVEMRLRFDYSFVGRWLTWLRFACKVVYALSTRLSDRT